MAKKIIQGGTDTYHGHCSECGCHFTYERSDVLHNYLSGGERVSCPHCGHSLRHLGEAGTQWGRGGGGYRALVAPKGSAFRHD